MLVTALPAELLFLALVQAVGLVSAFMAQRATGGCRQHIFQAVALLSMAIAGLAGLVISGSAPIRCLTCGTTFACMVLMATFDRCGFGLRPAPADWSDAELHWR